MERGFVVWLTGLSGAGKTTISERLAPVLRDRGLNVEVLDGDVVRRNLSKGLGFSKEDRDTNIRRIGFVAHLLQRKGVAVVVAAISPYREVRDEVRAQIGDFVEVYVRCSLHELTRRDVKGPTRRRCGARSPTSRASPTPTRSRSGPRCWWTPSASPPR